MMRIRIRSFSCVFKSTRKDKCFYGNGVKVRVIKILACLEAASHVNTSYNIKHLLYNNNENLYCNSY